MAHWATRRFAAASLFNSGRHVWIGDSVTEIRFNIFCGVNKLMRNTWLFYTKSSLVCLMIIVAAVINTGSVAAQSSDPSSLPLLSSAGLEYVGGFRVPAETVNGLNFDYGGQAMAFDPQTNSLFISSSGSVAEVSIPTPVNSSDVNALPFAQLLQPFTDPTEGHLRDLYSGDVKMEGLMVYGNRLYGTGYIYFDANNEQRFSHYSRSRQLNQASFSGWSKLWDTGRQGFVSGMMAPVPAAWQAKLGGPAITGQCCIPIIYRTSSGPAAFAFDPATVGQPAASATPLLYYPGEHATLGSWSGSDPTYGSTTEILGVAVIAGTRTILYVGRNGLGPYCYGSGTADPRLDGTTAPNGGPYCYDPTNSYKTVHSYPYRYQVWAYDMNDLAAVKAGAKQPWEVVPYGVWPLSLPTSESSVRLGGVGYDAQRQLLYVSQLRADADGYANRPIIHTFRVSATPGAVTEPADVVSSVTLTADKTAPQTVGTPVTFTAQPTGGVAPHQYKWIASNGTASTVAANWTTSNRVTWTPTAESVNHQISVWVRSVGNAADVPEASMSVAFPVTALTAANATTSVAISANRVAPQALGNAIRFTATPVGGTAPFVYKWFLSNGATWTAFSDWTSSANQSWYPTEANANYRVRVWVKAAANNADQTEASAEMAFAMTEILAPPPPPAAPAVSLTANRTAPQALGNAIGFTATPSGGTAPFVYKWFLSNGATWTAFGDWTSSANQSWYPTEANANYRVRVWVKAAANSADQAEASAEMAFAMTGIPAPPPPPAPPAVSLTANRTAPQALGNAIGFTATPAGGTAPFVYKWFLSNGATWTAFGDWTSSANQSWYPTEANANYRVRVWVKAAANSADQAEASAEMAFAMTGIPASPPPPPPPAPASAPVSAVKLTSDKVSPQAVGAAIAFTATPSGGTAPFVYKWSVSGGASPITTGWGGSNTFNWTPKKTDKNYRISVAVKRASSAADQAEATDAMKFNINNDKGRD